jgi:hypothetical protein
VALAAAHYRSYSGLHDESYIKAADMSLPCPRYNSAASQKTYANRAGISVTRMRPLNIAQPLTGVAFPRLAARCLVDGRLVPARRYANGAATKIAHGHESNIPIDQVAELEVARN